MASEMLSKVMAAEKADKDAQIKAAEEARNIVEEAQKKASAIISERKTRALAEGEKVVAAAKEDAAAAEQKAHETAKLQGEEIKAGAAQRREEAIKAVAEIVLS